jgi:hypothetical protein
MSRGVLRNHRYKSLLVAPAAVVCMTGMASADSMRCGKWVVNETTPLGELLSKCGQPRSKNVTRDDVYMTNASGVRVKTGNVTVTERWIFQASSRALPMELTIVDGKVVNLARVSR